MTEVEANIDAEISAIGKVYAAVSGLDRPSQLRVFKYVAEKLNLTIDVSGTEKFSSKNAQKEEALAEEADALQQHTDQAEQKSEDDFDFDGVSPIAIKWIKRNNIEPKQLQKIFSLGIDDIDLVAKDVPGKSKKERMRSVLLLQAIASYLSSGVAKVPYDRVKTAWEHYSAFDPPNAATHLKSFAPEVGGNKESGLTLTSRGLTSAAELLASMVGSQK